MKLSRLLRIILILGVMLLSTAACNILQDEKGLSFQSIERKDGSGTGDLYESYEPGLMVIARSEEVDRLGGLITDEARQTLLELDYSQYFALVTFFGMKGTGGYSIQVTRVTRSGDTVSVYARLDEPAPDQAKSDVVTSPYHLVIVQKDGSWGKAISFALIANHMLFFSVSHDVP